MEAETEQEEETVEFFAEIDALEKRLLQNRKRKKETKPFLLEKVISGGQTGADRAGLEAASALGIETGGTAPPEFMTSVGKDLSLKKFGLVQLPSRGKTSIAQGYIRRSTKNVTDSDASLVFRTHASSGTDKTIGYCIISEWKIFLKEAAIQSAEGGVWIEGMGYRNLCVVVDLTNPSAILRVQEFLREYHVKTLNIAGHRDDKRGFQERVTAFLMKALKE